MMFARVHESVFYPLGYPVLIVTASRDVLDCAGESWGQWKQIFEAAPLRLAVSVGEGAAAANPEFIARPNVLAYVADADNCGEFRTAGKSGWIRVSRGTLSHRIHFRYHFLEALVLTALDTVAFTPLHAACIGREDRAILLCGDSGAGKSSVAYEAARRGWTFVSDDSVHLARSDGGVLVGNPYKLHLRADAGMRFPEIAGSPSSAQPNGKTAIEVSTAALNTHVCWSGPAGCVFLHRRPGRVNLRSYPVGAALDYFREYAWWQSRARVYSEGQRVLAGGCWSLEYESSDAAVEFLAELQEPCAA